MNERLRAFRTLPLRDRERALDIAKVFGELFDEMAEALQTRQWHPDLLEEVVGMKPMLMETLEQGAEATYTVAVQKQALYIMERIQEPSQQKRPSLWSIPPSLKRLWVLTHRTATLLRAARPT